jgi:hypothetical protein
MEVLRDDGVLANEWGDGIVSVACGVLCVESGSPEQLDALEVGRHLVMMSGESAAERRRTASLAWWTERGTAL